MTAESRNNLTRIDVHCWATARQNGSLGTYPTQRFGCYGINTRSHNNEQTRKFVASKRLAKHAFSWQRMEETNTRTVGCGGLSLVRLEL
jgi:hypothetical protein